MKIFLWIKIQTVRKAIMRIGRRKAMRKLNPKVIFFTIMIILIIIPLIMRFFLPEDTEEVLNSNYSLLESARELNEKGLNSLDEDSNDEALNYFTEALDNVSQYQTTIQNKPSQTVDNLLSDIYNNLCLAYNLLEEYELGLEYGDLAIQISKDSSSVVYSNRGNSYLGLNRYEEAFYDYVKAMEIDDTNVYAMYGKGLVHYDQGEYEKALEAFDQYVMSTPDDMEAYEYMIWSYYYLGDYDKAITLSDEAIQIESNFDIYYAKGMNIQAKEGYEKAEIYYKDMIDLFNEEAEAYMILGKFYYNAGNYKSAEEYFIATKEKFGSNPDLECWIIGCYTEKGDMEKADSYYQKVLEEGNATVAVCNYIGNEFTYQGYYMESILYYEEAIRLNQKDKEAYINKLYSLCYGKRYSRCIEFGKMALEKLGEDYDILFYIGKGYYNLSDFKEALVWYERALDIDPANDTILSDISSSYFMLDDNEYAKEYANRALSINSYNTAAQNIKAEIEKKQNPIEEQLEEFIKTNYLYYEKENRIDKIFQHDNMTNVDISKALMSVKKEDDGFTFCLYDNYYTAYYESYLQDVEYVDYEYMKYIRIYNFNDNTDDQFIEIVDSIENPEDTILIIDLRMNGGGQTLAANNILDALLSNCVTCTIIDKDGYTYSYYSDASQVNFKEIFILVDGESASASELLTLGLKTFLNNVTIIGSNTYGKGVGQNIYENKEKKIIVFLVNHYWNVREKNIKDVGIAPDVYVKSNHLLDYIDVVKKIIN